MKFVTQDYYEILNVQPGATSEEVKQAYRVARQSFRPDSIAVHSLYSEDETAAISSKIEEAFQVLSSPESASRYRRYHRSSRIGKTVSRDANAFFDEVHQLDDPTALEALARQMGGMRTVATQPLERPHSNESPQPLQTKPLPGQDTSESVARPVTRIDRRRKQRSNGIRAMRPVQKTDELPLLTSLEEVVEEALTTASPAPAPKSSPQPSLPLRPSSPPSTVRVVPRASVSMPREAAPAAVDVSLQARALSAPSASVTSSPGLQAGGRRTGTATAAAKAPQSWGRERPKAPVTATLRVSALTDDTLEAIEIDCGGVNGSYLKRVRLEQGIELEYISQQTKISRSMLQSIEEEEVRHLPAQVYLKGYLMHISRLLKLPHPRTTSAYLAGLSGV